MSEYQYYEFVALDRPLTQAEMAALRRISTRAQITPTRFRNEYHWGDLKADPGKLLARYFDAHLYFANWPSRRFMMRLPKASMDLDALTPYFPGGAAKLLPHARHVVVDMWSEAEEAVGELDFDLSALVPLRAAFLRGELAPAYTAWLLAVQSGDVGPDEREPRVPAGFREPSASLAALMEFLQVDPDLVAAAAEGADAEADERANIQRWLKTLPAGEKDRLIAKALEEPDVPMGAALLATYRRQQPASPHKARTVATLVARAEEIRSARKPARKKRP